MRVCSECAGVHLPPSMYMCMATSTNVLPPTAHTPSQPPLKSQSRKGWRVVSGCHCSWHPPTSRHGPSAIWGWCVPKKRNTCIQVQGEKEAWSQEVQETIRVTPVQRSTRGWLVSRMSKPGPLNFSLSQKYKYNRNRNTVEIERQIQENVRLLACAKAKHPPFLRQRMSPIENKLHLSVQNIYIYVHIFGRTQQCMLSGLKPNCRFLDD